MTIAVFTGSSKDGAAISLMHSMLALFKYGMVVPSDVTIYYTYGLRKVLPSPDSDVFKVLSDKGVRLKPIVIPSDSRPFQYKKSAKSGIKEILISKLKKFIAASSIAYRFNRFTEKFDLIWINQLPYYKMLEIESNYKLIYARELFFNMDKSAIRIIQCIGEKCDMIVAIDQKAADPFVKAGLQHVITVTNPVAMEAARNIRSSLELTHLYRSRYGIGDSIDVITLIGNITPAKGAEFFLDIAEYHASDLSRVFIIVGGGKSSGNMGYYRSIIDRVENMKNVRVFDADQDEVQVFYGISSLVMRTDAFLPLGRTVFEALYSGLPVVLPCNPQDDTKEIEEYLDRRIFLYKSRDLISALEAIDKALYVKSDSDNLTVSNNYKEYADRISELFRCLENQGTVIPTR
jgi:glycosyltransferase involved in cell wall biosynthesis